MVIATREAQTLTDLELMAHLFRRAGFGATRGELDAALERGYEATVDELVNPERVPPLDHWLMWRYYVDIKELKQSECGEAYFVYRMINSPRPLEEKLTLFFHGLFATAWSKVAITKTLCNQLDMFRENCLGDYRTLLVKMARDPTMIFWLDNQMNTNEAPNENFGRELLELFSMGIGNYSERDVKECARAFTGWGLENTIPGVQPFGRFDWQYRFWPERHDYGEKTFLGETGTFDGEDVIEIIVRQPATARFVAAKLYDFFVSDTPDEAAIGELAEVFMQTDGNLRAMMKHLFLADWFRSDQAYYAKVKGGVEHVVSVARLVGDFGEPAWGINSLALECMHVGQQLLNPPSVEGWHTGTEWIDTGILVERINFAAAQVGDVSKPGIRRIVERLRSRRDLSPEQLVDGCLELIGPLRVLERNRSSLIRHAEEGGPVRWDDDPAAAAQRVGEMLQVIVATREYQFA